MSIASEIERLQMAKADIKTSIEGKEVEVPSSATLDMYSALIDSIPTGVRRPVLVWSAATDQKIYGTNTDITENPTWQITGLDLTPYKRVKCYVMPGGNTANFKRPHAVVDVQLDYTDPNNIFWGHYVGTGVFQYPNDANRLYGLTFCVSKNKDSVLFSSQVTLYGTASTSANDNNNFLYRIEGYYD